MSHKCTKSLSFGQGEAKPLFSKPKIEILKDEKSIIFKSDGKNTLGF